MIRKTVTLAFDTKKEVIKKGVGKVEIIVRLSRNSKKSIVLAKIAPEEWEGYQDLPHVLEQMERCRKIVEAMELVNEDMTVANFDKHLGIETKSLTPEVLEKKAEARRKAAEAKELKKKEKEQLVKRNFLDFMRDCIVDEQCRETTKKQKLVTYTALCNWGRITYFEDLTPKRIKEFDTWLHEDGTRSDVSIFNYHKRMKFYIRRAIEQELLKRNPYDSVKFNRGKCKERKPLTETELLVIRNLKKLTPKEEKVRDLFIFAAYTGLAFCDVQAFDFEKMAEQGKDLYYIDGSRLKTSTNFFTPILPPAMEVLKKYNFKLPTISNQKANDYLHLLETRANINKNITFHLARHSFATLALSHDVPIEKVARMLGHKDIKTTQVYAKILKSTIENYGTELSKSII